MSCVSTWLLYFTDCDATRLHCKHTCSAWEEEPVTRVWKGKPWEDLSALLQSTGTRKHIQCKYSIIWWELIQIKSELPCQVVKWQATQWLYNWVMFIYKRQSGVHWSGGLTEMSVLAGCMPCMGGEALVIVQQTWSLLLLFHLIL